MMISALVLVLGLLLGAPVPVEAQRLGIEGRPAPAWEVTTWFGLPDGKERLEITDLRGKVVYLFCFQSWCPGCHSHGFPTLVEVHEHYRERPGVAFVAVQTVFEGFSTNTAWRAQEEVEGYGLDIPVGHDTGPEEEGSLLMRRYRSGGTPWTVIIDAAGIVRFNGFGIEPEQAVELIDRLLEAR